MPQADKNSRFPYLLALVLVLLLINGIRSIFNVYSSVGRLDQAKFQLDELKVENSRLKNDIAYAQTPEYLQKAAIEELNMAKPGETILVVEQMQPQSQDKAESETKTQATKPVPVELWATEFNLQNVYFNWRNSHF